MSAGSKAVKSGKRFEGLIKPLLQDTKYAFDFQQRFPNGKPWGTLCVLDVLIYDTKTGEKIAVSQKNQSSTGTVEEKIWWEMLLMSSLIAKKYADRAYIVLMGTGWSPSLKEFVHSRFLKSFLPKLAYGLTWEEAHLEIVSLDEFSSKIEKGEL